jgi:hypothetical protein
MYNKFRYFWSYRNTPKIVEKNADFRPLPQPWSESDPRLAELPADYVAVKLYFSDCFPETDENRDFAARLIARLARTSNVVLLSTGLVVDDHTEFSGETAGAVIDARDLMTPRDNLEVQSRIIAGSQRLYTSYGGFSYLGPFYGVPSVNFYSVANFNATHLVMMQRVLAGLGDHARFLPMHVRDLALVEPLVEGAGVVLDDRRN